MCAHDFKFLKCVNIEQIKVSKIEGAHYTLRLRVVRGTPVPVTLFILNFKLCTHTYSKQYLLPTQNNTTAMMCSGDLFANWSSGVPSVCRYHVVDKYHMND